VLISDWYLLARISGPTDATVSHQLIYHENCLQFDLLSRCPTPLAAALRLPQPERYAE